MLRLLSAILVLLTLESVAAVTYTGCHDHGTIQYCYGANGEETPVLTYSSTAGSASNTAAGSAAAATITSAPQTTAVTDCHNHGTETFCVNGKSEEVEIVAEGTATMTAPPAAYTGCHSHGSDTFCLDPAGGEVQVLAAGAEHGGEEHDHDHDGADGHAEGVKCHYHAGVEHCLAPGESESSSAPSCGLTQRDYNVKLRVGTLFVVLVTSSIGVFAPIALKKILSQRISTIALTITKQLGVGIIASTALVHLLTHAELMFANECLSSRITYEATATAICLAGIFLSFLIEFVGQRIVIARYAKQTTNPGGEKATRDSDESAINTKSTLPATAPNHTLASLGHDHYPNLVNSKFSVLVMEAGIIFHSILIGLTLVVAGDDFYLTLLVVIIFHQFFEGLALGSRIAVLPASEVRFFPTKFSMAAAYGLITPLGMAIGIGVLNSFNGNDPSTVIAIGTLDAFSAGILLWVGLVDMWATDWMLPGGDMMTASLGRTLLGGLSLVTGLVLMSLLGKWA